MKIEEFKKAPGIYIITIKNSVKVYIGESISVKDRLKNHLRKLRKQKHTNPILQNLYSKYGEDSFDFNILEYLDTKDKKILKKKEASWQKKFKHCISLDSNKYNQTDFRKSRKTIYAENGRKTIHYSIEVCKKPIIIFDVINGDLIYLPKIKDGTKYIEYKHLKANLESDFKLIFKNRYVAYYQQDFSGVDFSKIIFPQGNCKTLSLREIITVYNLKTSKSKRFSSKRQLCAYLGLKRFGADFFDKLKRDNTIWWNYETIFNFDKNSIKNATICLKQSNKGVKQVNLIEFYKGLKENLSLVELGKRLGVTRHTLSDAFKERSRKEWFNDLNEVITTLPE